MSTTRARAPPGRRFQTVWKLGAGEENMTEAAKLRPEEETLRALLRRADALNAAYMAVELEERGYPSRNPARNFERMPGCTRTSRRGWRYWWPASLLRSTRDSGQPSRSWGWPSPSFAMWSVMYSVFGGSTGRL